MIARLPEKLQFTMLILCSVTVGTPVVAQAAQDDADGWDFVVAPYVLFPHMNGGQTIRGIPSEVAVGPSDIFENLDFGAMLYLEMANPDWAITLDGLYMDLGASAELPLSGRTGTADTKQLALEAKGLRRVAEWAEVGIGARLNTIETGLFVEAGMVLPEIDVSSKHTWFDPLIAARLMAPFESRWRLGISGDIGGFGIGSSIAWQVLPFVGYRFATWFELALTYRAMGMDYETGGGTDLFVYDMTVFGPEIGFVFHF